MADNANIARIVVIPGASSGIGLAAARLFRDRGDRVYCLSRRDPEERDVTFIRADVTDEDSVRHAFAEIGEREGRIDVLLSNAGMGVSGAAECTSMQDAKRQLDVNFFGLHACVRAAVPLMREHGGTILATSSVAAVFAIPFQAFYSASKFALNALILALANELKPFNIKVAAIMPGDVRTGFTDARIKEIAGAEHYGSSIDKSVAVMEHDERGGMGPEMIAKRFVALSLKKHPKVLSTVGLQYKLFCFLGKALPIRLQNWIVGKMYIK